MLIGLLSVLAIVSCKEKEEAQKLRLTKLLKSKEAPAAEEKPDGTSISVGTDGVDVSTKMEQAQQCKCFWW
jgi:hypothetical protein